MNNNTPIINFNGAFLVDSLVVGSLVISSKRVSAVRIMLQQTLNYPLLAYGRTAAEIYVYCFDAHVNKKRKLEAYAPCIMVRDQYTDGMKPLVTSISWYISSAMRKKHADQVTAVLHGEILGDETYPEFQGNPFALFETE